MMKIVVPILNDEYKVIVCWGTMKERAKVLRSYHYPANYRKLLRHTRGQAFSHDGCHPVITMPCRPQTTTQVGTLAHEAVHAVTHIFQTIDQGIYCEVFAHSVGAVVRTVLQKSWEGR